VLFTTEAPLNTDEKVVFAQRIITLQPNRDVIDPCFLHYVLHSSTVQHRIHENATGATATEIKASLLKKICISLPKNVAVQCRLATALAETEEECDATKADS
jgi:type I restriction enzyme S subunit